MTAITLTIGSSTVTVSPNMLGLDRSGGVGTGTTAGIVTVGKATGYAELRSSGTISGLTAGTPTATTPAASGFGWVLDDASLGGGFVNALSTNVSFQVFANLAGVTAAFYVRLFNRSSAGVYTSIGMATIAAAAVPTTITTMTGSFTPAADTFFATGDRLYVDIIAQVTANTSGNNGTTLTAQRGGTADFIVPDITAPPGITSVSPSAGSTSGGTSVTISGFNFTGASSVTFNSIAATSVVVHSDTNITCITPAGTAGAVTVSVSTPVGFGTGSYTYRAPAAITSISPTSGPPGTLVTITGTNLDQVTTIRFQEFFAVATSLTIVNSTTVTCIVPSNAAPNQAVAGWVWGSETSGQITVDYSTFNGYFTPTTGDNGIQNNASAQTAGTTLTTANSGGSGNAAFANASGTYVAGGMHGNGFQLGSGDYVQWDSSSSGVGSYRTTYGRAYVSIPSSGTTNASIAFIGTNGSTQIAQVNLLAGSAWSIYPPQGGTATGSVALAASTFYRMEWSWAQSTQSFVMRLYAGDSTTVLDTISFSTSTASPALMTVDDVTFYGVAGGAIWDDLAFFPVGPLGPAVLAITSFSPTSVAGTGGSTVVLTGTNFLSTTAVTLGGTAVTSFTVDSATQITVVTPAKGAGSYTFAVTNAPYGTATSSTSLTVTAPVVSGATALTASSTLTAAGARGQFAAASLAGSSTLTTAGGILRSGVAALTSSSTLTAAGTRGVSPVAALTASSTFTKTALVADVAAAALVASATLTPVPTQSLAGAAALSASASLTPTSVVVRSGAAALSGSAVLTTVGARGVAAVSALTASSTLTTIAVISRVGVGSLVAATTLTVAATGVDFAALSLAAAGTLSVVAFRAQFAASALSASAALTAAGVTSSLGSIALVAASVLTATVEIWRFGTYPPDGIALQTGLSGALATIQDDPDAPDTNYMLGTGGAVDLRVTWPQTPGALRTGSGRQHFRIRMRKS